MADVSVSISIDAPPSAVWASIEDIESHVEWMADAEAIRFTGDARSGLGTRFVCDTKVGPIRLADQMEITEWRPPVADGGDGLAADGAMGVRHVGIVTGAGTMFLEAEPGGESTRFTWVEDLEFPWYLGGRLGEVVGGRFVLAPLWRRNLRRLKRLVEASGSSADRT